MKRQKSRRLLLQRLQELAAEAKKICPEAEVTFEPEGVEEVDAWLQVVVPDGQDEKVHDALRPLRNAIYEADGFWVGLNVLTQSEVKEVGVLGKERR